MKNDMPWKISRSHGTPELDKESSVWQSGSHINDQFITVCQGRERGKDGKKENVSQQAFKETDFLPGEQRNADIFLLATRKRF